MSVNAVVIVRNSTGISAPSLVERLADDPWGRHAATHLAGRPAWKPFTWEGDDYLAWLTGPRVRYLGLYGVDEDDRPLADPEHPSTKRAAQITFFRAMLALERLAGGPIHVGNDVISPSTPEDAAAQGWDFSLPPRLDDLVPAWRDAEALWVDEPFLVF